MFRTSCKLCFLASKTSLPLVLFCSSASLLPYRHCLATCFSSSSSSSSSSSYNGFSKGCSDFRASFGIRTVSTSTSSLLTEEQMEPEGGIHPDEFLPAVEDMYDGVMVEMKEPMDRKDFIPLLRASIIKWRQQGKKGVWIKLPIRLASLVEPVVQEGFRYHHAEPDYLMLVYWIPKTPDTLPINASHRVGIGAFVLNSNREVLVVEEKSGEFKGSGVWKLPTGVVNEGEDICTAAIREVKEETGIETEFVEVLGFRQSHRSFFSKSDMFFICMLRPRTFDIQKQDLEIEAAQWMRIEEYVDQPYNKEHQLFKYVAEICKSKAEKDYVGFSAVPVVTASGKETYLYFNNRDFNQLDYGQKP